MDYCLPFFRIALHDDKVFVPGHFRSLNPASMRMEDPNGTLPNGTLIQIYTGAREEEACYWSSLLTKVVASVDLRGEYARVVRLDLENPDLHHINVFGMVVPKACAHNKIIFAQDLTIMESLRVGGTFSHPLEGNYLVSQFLRIITLTMNRPVADYLRIGFDGTGEEGVPSAYTIEPDIEFIQEMLEDSPLLTGAFENEVTFYTAAGHAFGPYPDTMPKDAMRAAALERFCEHLEIMQRTAAVEESSRPMRGYFEEAFQSYQELLLGIIPEL